MGLHRENVQVTKKLSGGQDTSAPFHSVATILYRGKLPLNPHQALAGAVFRDVPNYYDRQPTVLIGEVLD